VQRYQHLYAFVAGWFLSDYSVKLGTMIWLTNSEPFFKHVFRISDLPTRGLNKLRASAWSILSQARTKLLVVEDLPFNKTSYSMVARMGGGAAMGMSCLQ
jgi:hypothetical protein